METGKFIFIAILIALLSTLSVQAQIAAGGTKHFEKNGLEFDYPAAWQTTERSLEESEFVELAGANKTVQFIVQWQFVATLSCEFEGMRKRLTQELADRVATQIHAPAPPATSWQKTQLGNVHVDQIQLRGQLNNVPVMADVYSLAANHYFLNLVYLRVANEAIGNSAWETIRATLKVNELIRLAKGTIPSSGGILNGRAIRLPAPSYPPLARVQHASGTVVVQVLVDELGDVIAACVISGDPALRYVSEEAARHAKFTSTKLSGKPERVTGVITYNFVLQ